MLAVLAGWRRYRRLEVAADCHLFLGAERTPSPWKSLWNCRKPAVLATVVEWNVGRCAIPPERRAARLSVWAICTSCHGYADFAKESRCIAPNIDSRRGYVGAPCVNRSLQRQRLPATWHCRWTQKLGLSQLHRAPWFGSRRECGIQSRG